MVGRVPGVASPHRRVEIRYVPYSHCPAVMSALPPHPMFFSERVIGLFGETNGRLYLATIHEIDALFVFWRIHSVVARARAFIFCGIVWVSAMHHPPSKYRYSCTSLRVFSVSTRANINRE